MSEWKIMEVYVKGVKHFQIYRLRNVHEMDHAGNRIFPDGCFAGGFYSREDLAKEECDRLNGLLREDKCVSTQKLFEFMKTCRQFEDLEKLEYMIAENNEEYIIGTFKGGYQKRAYVTGDSCYALGMDALRWIGN